MGLFDWLFEDDDEIPVERENADIGQHVAHGIEIAKTDEELRQVGQNMANLIQAKVDRDRRQRGVGTNQRGGRKR